MSENVENLKTKKINSSNFKKGLGIKGVISHIISTKFDVRLSNRHYFGTAGYKHNLIKTTSICNILPKGPTKEACSDTS